MKPRLLAIYLLLVLAPLALLVWLGARLVREERSRAREQYRELVAGRLQEIHATIRRYTDDRAREFLRLTDLAEPDPDDLRELVRVTPHVRQVFVLTADGKVTHPPADDASAAERDFLQRAGQLWRDRPLFLKSGEGGAPWGWYSWYWGDGLHLAFWQRHPTGHVVGVELDRARLLADVIALLPDSVPDGRLIVADATGAALHQAGAAGATEPVATVPLATPLASWRLEFFPRGPIVQPGGWPVWVAVAAAFVALLVLAAYFYREHTRELREAAQRVSFVNQVSHELKTPLTNIRMYAELLHRDQPSRPLDIIVAESQRLSRLINNVLTFARRHNHRLALRPTTGTVDEVIRAVAESFRAALEAKGVRIELDLQVPSPTRFDRDALEQILGNLISNVEKYAATGGHLAITSRAVQGAVTITVADRGPGIPASHREKIFQPFYRLSDQLTDGVAGTGIGLTIARDLARLHGGDVTLTPSEAGAHFEIRLNTP